MNEWMKESENLSESLAFTRKVARVFNELFVRFRPMLLEKKANWLWITDGNSFSFWTFSGNLIAYGKPLHGNNAIDIIVGIVIIVVYPVHQALTPLYFWAHLLFSSTLWGEYYYCLHYIDYLLKVTKQWASWPWDKHTCGFLLKTPTHWCVVGSM